jgi:hypothetical protein
MMLNELVSSVSVVSVKNVCLWNSIRTRSFDGIWHTRGNMDDLVYLRNIHHSHISSKRKSVGV